MFNGLPFTYRRSVLADVDKVKKFALSNIVCVDPNLLVCNCAVFMIIFDLLATTADTTSS
jgi:hypothetical protein